MIEFMFYVFIFWVVAGFITILLFYREERVKYDRRFKDMLVDYLFALATSMGFIIVLILVIIFLPVIILTYVYEENI